MHSSVRCALPELALSVPLRPFPLSPLPHPCPARGTRRLGSALSLCLSVSLSHSPTLQVPIWVEGPVKAGQYLGPVGDGSGLAQVVPNTCNTCNTCKAIACCLTLACICACRSAVACCPPLAHVGASQCLVQCK